MEVGADPVPSESEELLTGLARKRFGRISEAQLARHVLALTEGAAWPVRRAAMEALIRRYAFAVRDGLRVATGSRPALGTPVRIVGGGRARPYHTVVYSLAPLHSSCGCADFLRSSLGLCKHGLVLLESLGTKRPRSAQSSPERPRRPRLAWDPREPLLGPGDRLARLQYTHAGRSKRVPGFVSGVPSAKLLAGPAARLAFVRALQRRLARGSLDAEPAASALLSEERVRCERLIALGAPGARLRSLTQLKRKLYPYQRAGAARFFETGRLLLADDMGLGKTTQAIACCHGMMLSGAVQRGLLIVPAALKPQWLREWEATTHIPLVAVDGSPAERARIYAARSTGFLMVGYELLLRDFAAVQQYAPELVVLDEGQRIKNWATKSASYVKALAPAYRLVLTGTPMENRLDELASIMDFIDDTALEPKWRLAPLHQVQQGDGGKGTRGAQHLGALRARLAAGMLRRVRTDVLTQLPSRTDTRVPVELTEAQRARHDELIQPIAELASISARRPLSQAEFLRLMQLLTTQRILCNGIAQLDFADTWPRCEQASATPALLESLFAPKLGVLRGLIEQLVMTQGRKVVVFSQWRAMLRLSAWAVRDVLAAAGQRAVFFTGAESPRLRERAIAEFHDDPHTSVMFLSDAGGVGLNLQRAASACINLELPWNPAVLEQRIGRIHRLGQPLPIDVFNLVTEDGIEARIARLISQKKAVFSSLFDGTTDSVRFDGDATFMEGVRRLMEPSAPALPAPDEALEVELPLADDGAPAAAVSEPAPANEAGLEHEAGFKIERLPDGAFRIEAPPAIASSVAQVFELMAAALRASAVHTRAGAP